MREMVAMIVIRSGRLLMLLRIPGVVHVRDRAVAFLDRLVPRLNPADVRLGLLGRRGESVRLQVLVLRLGEVLRQG